MPRRLATKLIIALALIVLSVKATSLLVNLKSQENQLLQSMTLGADQLSRSITSATWHSMLADHREAAYQVMKTIAEKQGIERIRMFNKDGVLMFSTAPNERLHVDERAEVCTPCHASATPLRKVDVRSRSRVFRTVNGHRSIAMITPIYNEPSCSQASCHAHPASISVLGVLDLTLDASGVDQELAALRRRTAMLAILELLLIGGLIVFFTRKFVERPILQLIEATETISEMNLDQAIRRIRSSEELEQLAQSFDRMRLRLKAAVEENAEFTRSLETKVEQRTAELRVAQHKLVQSDRLASLGQLAASVAHEINNPISGVLNLSMLMQRILKPEGIPHGRVPEFKRYLGQVASETTRVGRIVSDLLAFSRRSRPQTTEADLNAIIRSTVSLLSHKLELASVQVRFELEESLPLVLCDSSQMQQVVMNLVANAAEAIHGSGTVTIATARLDDGASVLLKVSDTGAGIPAEALDKIFDPFFTTKEEGKGVGLGLAVVYGIVEAHGGEIDVSSRLGEGSVFTVTIPAGAAASAKRGPQPLRLPAVGEAGR